MKNASRIITVVNRLSFPQHSLEEIVNKPRWTGNKPAREIEKSLEISGVHESLLFSSVFSTLTGTLEIIFISNESPAAGYINIPVKACFLFTFIKGTKGNMSLPWSSSLS
jgi:hypothetical protein